MSWKMAKREKGSKKVEFIEFFWLRFALARAESDLSHQTVQNRHCNACGSRQDEIRFQKKGKERERERQWETIVLPNPFIRKTKDYCRARAIKRKNDTTCNRTRLYCIDRVLGAQRCRWMV